MDQNPSGGNVRYSVSLEKLEERLEKKRKEMEKTLPPSKRTQVSTISKMFKYNGLSDGIYSKIRMDGNGTEKNLKRIAKIAGCDNDDDWKEFVNEDIDAVKRRKNLIHNTKKNLENAEPGLFNSISALLETMVPVSRIQDFKDTDSIGYKRNSDGSYQVVVPLSEKDWKNLYKQANKPYNITIDSEENFEEELKKEVKKKLIRKCRNEAIDVFSGREDLDPDKKEAFEKTEEGKKRKYFEELIESIDNRKVVAIESPNRYMKILVENYFQVMIQELDENARKASQFCENDAIEYFALEDGGYKVTLPFDEDYCCQLNLDYPLELDVDEGDLPDDFDEDDFEEVLREAIENKFHEDYDCQITDEVRMEELEEQLARLYDLPLEESIVHDFDEADFKKDKRSAMCYTTLFQILYLRNELPEISKVMGDSNYAYKKFKEFGIPIPFERKE